MTEKNQKQTGAMYDDVMSLFSDPLREMIQAGMVDKGGELWGEPFEALCHALGTSAQALYPDGLPLHHEEARRFLHACLSPEGHRQLDEGELAIVYMPLPDEWGTPSLALLRYADLDEQGRIVPLLVLHDEIISLYLPRMEDGLCTQNWSWCTAFSHIQDSVLVWCGDIPVAAVPYGRSWHGPSSETACVLATDKGVYVGAWPSRWHDKGTDCLMKKAEYVYGPHVLVYHNREKSFRQLEVLMPSKASAEDLSLILIHCNHLIKMLSKSGGDLSTHNWRRSDVGLNLIDRKPPKWRELYSRLYEERHCKDGYK